LSGCTKCHWGDVVVEERATGEEQPIAQKKTCVEFPHAPHVGAANLSCLQCHVAAANGRDIETLPGALLCNQCHDHKEGQPGEPKYEGLFNGGALSCVRCHHEATAGNAAPVAVVPLPGSAATDARYLVDQTTFGGFADAQFHPLAVACTECHKANESNGRLVELLGGRNADPLSATLNVSVHAGGGRKEPAECLRCHWKPVGKWRDAVNTSAGTEEDKALRFRPGSKQARDKFGNDSEGYPGKTARG
jgi:hypothetical protein